MNDLSSWGVFWQTSPLTAHLLVALYFLVLIVLAIYGLHRYFLVYLYRKHRPVSAQPGAHFEELPRVVVQLPVFNERYVVERLIDAVCQLDYPKDLLEIQLLDDSTDDTTGLAASRIAYYQQQGIPIKHLRRCNPVGFKAGALQYGMEQSDGEFFAIFDADFVPSKDTLRRMIHFFTDPEVGMVQLRWGHLNRSYSMLTQAQAILLDGHFVLESGGRNRAGLFFNFNGTGGMWRRQAIEDAGGWQQDTLTEDLDLSYRAQIQGWRFLFLPDFTSPAELPVDMNSFKSQQYRWAKGSIQTARKILPGLLSGPHTLAVKSEAFFHLTANLAYPLMVLLGILTLPALTIRLQRGWLELFLVDLPLFLAATLSVSAFYAVSQRELDEGWRKRLKYFPVVMGLGIGISLSNTKAVLEGLLGVQSAFVRTPKFRIESGADRWRPKVYRAHRGWLPWLELALGGYFIYIVGLALISGIYATAPFLALFMFGFLGTGALSLWQT